MLPGGARSGGSAGLGDRGVGLGLFDAGLEQGALHLRDEAEGLGRGEVALARLLCRVGVGGKALERGGLVGAGVGDVGPGGSGGGVIAQVLVGAGGEDRDRGVGLLDQCPVVLVILGKRGQLLLAGVGELASAGVDVGAARPRGAPARLDEAGPGRGAGGIGLGGFDRALLLLTDR